MTATTVGKWWPNTGAQRAKRDLERAKWRAAVDGWQTFYGPAPKPIERPRPFARAKPSKEDQVRRILDRWNTERRETCATT